MPNKNTLFIASFLLILIILTLPFLLGMLVLGLDGDTNSPQTGIYPITDNPGISNPKDKSEWKAIFQYAGEATKVPWEFIAAITWQETSMGKNLGSCSYFPVAPGGFVLTTGKGLRSPEDKSTFEKIANTISIEKNRGVSCPAPSGGSGGAMGYTQVMPREWDSHAKKFQSLLNHYPNPWNAQDAVIMAGLILRTKAGLSDLTTPLAEDEATLKRTAGAYYGSQSSSYKDKVYAKYLEIKQSQEL